MNEQSITVSAETDRLLNLLYSVGALGVRDFESPLRRLKRLATWGQLTPAHLTELDELREKIEKQSGTHTWRR